MKRQAPTRPARTSAPPRIVRAKLSLLLAIVAATACGEPEPPALSVGPVAFAETDLLGLSDARRQTLATLAAFGLSVADSSTTAVGQPLIDTWGEDRLLEILAADLTLEKNGIEDAVLEARYLTDPEWELTVRHILFFSERWRPAAHRSEAEAKAGRAMEALRSGADFAQTAAELSEEPGAEGRQGLLTPGREGSWVPEFWAAALALQPADISPVTETQYGYHILRLEDRQVVPFAEARTVVAREVADRIEDPAAVLSAWMSDNTSHDAEDTARDTADGAARAEALEEARERGLSVPAGEAAELIRRWDDEVYRWSATLGFSYGAGPEQVREAALAALARPGQNAGIARDELDARASLVRAPYEIWVATTP